uniref:G-protein coupled receptors family 1 profile domain-containing protein n=1 Tax=Anopheles culicifacies TaxID=139723 RepID=A0A182LT07_9DIPT
MYSDFQMVLQRPASKSFVALRCTVDFTTRLSLGEKGERRSKEEACLRRLFRGCVTLNAALILKITHVDEISYGALMIKMMVTVVIVFTICWLPFNFLMSAPVTGTGSVFSGIGGAGGTRTQSQRRAPNGGNGGGRRKRRCCQNGGDGENWKNGPDQCIELIILETNEELTGPENGTANMRTTELHHEQDDGFGGDGGVGGGGDNNLPSLRG